MVGLASGFNTIILNSVLELLYQMGSFHLGHRELVVLKRSREKHLVVGSCSVPYILRGMIKHFVVRLA